MEKTLKNRFLWIGLGVALVAVVVIWLTPFAISRGLRLWIDWKARQQNLTVMIDRIDAPFLRPVSLHGIHIANTPNNPLGIDISAAQATIDLNLRFILLQRRGRPIGKLSITNLRIETHRHRPGAALSESGWRTLEDLFPDTFSLDRLDLRVEDGSTVILLRNAALSASEIEAGRFKADEATIGSPWFRQSFAGLRGATNWQENHLTIAGLSLARGLDLQWITINLSDVDKQRLAIDFEVDAFGGKIRASVSNEWPSQRSIWNLAGSANDISLAQTSEALGFTDQIGGLLHACKFTFRGDLSEPMQAAATLWTELTELTWRNRAAEVIMLGASLYNQQIDIQQLYVKQSRNQLTLRGEAVFPSKSPDWLSPDFRGDISASIDQLGEFAALFGASPGNFAGKVTIEGTVNARERQLGGQLTVNGASLTVFKTAIDQLNAKLNLRSTQLEIEQLDLKRKNDSLTARGKIDMAHAHDYSGTFQASFDDFVEYLSIFLAPAQIKPTPVHVEATIDSSKWDARGTINLPGSSALTFNASFILPVSSDWNTFLASPLTLTLDFPSIFLGNGLRVFSPTIFRDGILSGRIELSESLWRPRIIGDVHLLNGKLQTTAVNLKEASARITFNGNRASIDFFNAATDDVDLSVRGEIDFHDENSLSITLKGNSPIFDNTPRAIECVSKVEVVPITATLTPAVAEVEIRGPPFRSGWTLNLKERPSTQSSPAFDMNDAERKFPLSLGASSDENTLFLGAPPRPPPPQETPRPKKRRSPR